MIHVNHQTDKLEVQRVQQITKMDQDTVLEEKQENNQLKKEQQKLDLKRKEI